MPVSPEIPYSIYKEASPIEYWEYLGHLNKRYYQEIQARILPLESVLMQHQACAVLMGSDGKGEKHAQSWAEIIYLQPSSGNLNHTIITQTMPDYTNFFEVDYEGNPSVRYTGNDSLLSYVYGNSSHVYPDTILNSCIVSGHEATALEARTQVLNEIAHTTRIRRKIDEQIKEYLKWVQTGVSRNQTCFFFEHDQVVALYDERPGLKQLGVKPVIRLVQRTLDLLTQQQLASAQLTPELAAHTLPTATVKRLEYFEQDKDIAYAYLWFLQWFHENQEGYKANRQLSSATRSYEMYQEHIRVIFNWINTIRPGLFKALTY
jgi:hypothetical protein